MPDIKTPITFSVDLKSEISKKLADPKFTYTDWGSDELAPLRAAVRNHYRSQQLGKCAYCRQSLSTNGPGNCHVEHIAPKSKYLKFIFEPKNLCAVCADCNTLKRELETLQLEPDTVRHGDSAIKYPKSSGRFFLVHPHFDVWDEHIKIFGNYVYVDLSTKGHFTIGACKLNRHLHQFGWDPPFYEDAKLSDAMNRFMESDSSSQKLAALSDLKAMLWR
ncbi:HNH endonuclease [Rhizobacter fulvus]